MIPTYDNKSQDPVIAPKSLPKVVEQRAFSFGTVQWGTRPRGLLELLALLPILQLILITPQHASGKCLSAVSIDSASAPLQLILIAPQLTSGQRGERSSRSSELTNAY